MDNQRLILVLVFFFSVFMLWDGWQKQGQPLTAGPGAVASVPAASAGKAADASVPTTTLASAGAAAPDAAGLPQAGSAMAAGERRSFRTDLFIAEISAEGGNLTRLELLQHPATEDKNKHLVLFDNGEKNLYLAQSGLIGDHLPTHKSPYRFVSADTELKADQDKLLIKLETEEANGVRASKTYVFHRGSYLIDVGQEIENNGAAPVSAHAYFQAVRDSKPPAGTTGGAFGVHVFTGPAIYTAADKYQKVTFEEIAEGKAKHALKADNGWVAMVQHYFLSAWLPQGQGPREFFTRKLGDDLYAAGVILPMTAVAPGTSSKLTVPLYAGPQEQTKLEQIAPGLDLVVDYGMLTVIAAPLFWVLEQIHRLVGNWGWAIIVLTVLIKLAFWPLSAASYKSMAKMKAVAPKMNRLKELHGDDRQRLNQELMDLYKREKINPLGGCLPILIQIPVFLALYWVLLGTVEMRYAPFFGYLTDLSAMDPYYILPIIMGGTMVIQTKLNPPPPDPIQAKVMTFMPIAFTGMFLFFPSGLVLYWIVNNLLSIYQQWHINRIIEGGEQKTA